MKEFEDTEGVIRIRKSQKHRQHHGQQKNNKRTKTKQHLTVITFQ
jgi:hypothetical protein